MMGEEASKKTEVAGVIEVAEVRKKRTYWHASFNAVNTLLVATRSYFSINLSHP
jgi:ABC-type amino acid transport system permease subunit